MWILSKIITNHPTEKDLPTQHIFHKFWQTSVLQTQMRKHKKAEEIHGVAKKSMAANPSWSLLTCSYANSLCQSLTGEASTAVLQHPWKKSLLFSLDSFIIYNCFCWSCAGRMPGWGKWDCSGRQQHPRFSPSCTRWLMAWPWEILITFRIRFDYLPHRNAGKII